MDILVYAKCDVGFEFMMDVGWRLLLLLAVMTAVNYRRSTNVITGNKVCRDIAVP